MPLTHRVSPTPAMTQSTRWMALIAILLLPLAGCQSGSESSMSYDEGMDMESIEEQAAPMAAEADAIGDHTPMRQASQTQVDAPAPADRQLIRTASVRLRADNHAEAVEQARQLVDAVGGFVGNEDSQRYSDRVETTLTLRVPNTRFDTLLTAVSELAGEVESRSVDVDDVTRQVADMSARLETKRAAEAQYRELLSRSGSIEDILAVQTRLQQVREEIESTEAQLRALRDQVSLSTIRLTVFEASAAGITSGPGFFARAGRSIANGWEGILELTLALLTLWPMLLLGGAFVWFARRRWQKWKAQAKKAA